MTNFGSSKQHTCDWKCLNIALLQPWPQIQFLSETCGWLQWVVPQMGVPPLVYKGKSNENGWFWGTPIYGNPQVSTRLREVWSSCSLQPAEELGVRNLLVWKKTSAYATGHNHLMLGCCMRSSEEAEELHPSFVFPAFPVVHFATFSIASVNADFVAIPIA